MLKQNWQNIPEKAELRTRLSENSASDFYRWQSRWFRFPGVQQSWAADQLSASLPPE
jgi:hypothetical protein